MKIYLQNHGYTYAVEQIFLLFFPDERPVYPESAPQEGEDYCLCALSTAAEYTTAHTRILYSGKLGNGYSRVKNSALSSEKAKKSLLQKIIKLSFYKAASAALGLELPWGSLTGVRPAKVAEGLLSAGNSRKKSEGRLVRDFFVSPGRAALCLDAAEASLRIKSRLPQNGLSLYAGIPFCPTRCSYCSFVSSSVEKSLKLIEPYMQALLSEIKACGDLLPKAEVSSVYIGGGTPTTLSAGDLERLMSALSESFVISCEYTVEAGRPDTISAEKLRAIKRGGATRISINPQTTSDSVLRAIGRAHSAAQVFEAYELARSLDCGAINMDLIAGLPSDSPEGFAQSLKDVISLRPENITVHTLAVKKGSDLSQGGNSLPSPADVGRMLAEAENLLFSAGYRPYYLYRQKFMAGSFENIGWSLPGFESVYNVLIMEELQSIVSFGAGGVTKLVNSVSGKIERISSAKYPLEYINGIEKIISDKQKVSLFFSGQEGGIR